MASVRIRIGIAFAASLAITCAAMPAHSAAVDLAAIKPTCGSPFDLKDGACVVNPDKLKTTKPDLISDEPQQP